jgi:ATP-dependent DNA ligase
VDGLGDRAHRLGDRGADRYQPLDANAAWLHLRSWGTLVIEVAFLEWGRHGLMHDARFLGIREDKVAL